MRCLVIDPDDAIRQSIALMLRSEGLTVDDTDLGEDGVDLAKLYDYDVLTLELRLDDMRGEDVIRQLRAAKVTVPIIVVTRVEGVDAEVGALSLGADDFIRKPFRKDVLVQRINAVARRARGHSHRVLSVGPISLDTGAKALRVSDYAVPLTGKEYALIELLALRAGQVLTKSAILDHLYGGRDEPGEKIVDVFVCKIRRKLEPHGAEALLETVWGRGYRLVPDLSHRDVPALPLRESAAVGTMKARMLSRIAAGDVTIADLFALNPAWMQSSVRATVSVLLSERRIEKISHHPAVYRIRATMAAA